jgi:iron complex outermembrane recepter protein
MKLDFRQRLLGTTLLVGASMLATPAFAQETPVDPAASPPSGPVEAQPTPTESATGAPVEETRDIVVTGTRIPSANLESAAPVTVVSNQDFKLQGTSRVEDLLNSLPSVGASQASGVANGASGTAEVDLRYLGSKRTLALINGRRMVPGDPNSTTQAADLNFIPSSLIKRAEVLTGGASSVYGADAVAGVVNFIMDTSFTGIRFDGQYSFYQHNNTNPSLHTQCFSAQGSAGCGGAGEDQTIGSILAGRGFSAPTGSVADGGAFDGTLSFGVNFDDNRGHAVAYFGYRNVNPVLQSRRDYSACVIQESARVTNGFFPFVYGPNNVRCGGSATANPGNAVIFTSTNTVTELGAPFLLVTSTVAGITPTGFGGANTYNFAPLNYFQRPDERYIGGVFADYEISPAIKPYLEFMFMDDHTLAQIAPSGDFGNTLTINCDNPLLAPAHFNRLCDPNGLNIINGFLGTFPLAAGARYNPNPGNAPIDFVNTDPNVAPGTTYNRAYFQLLRRNTEGGPRVADLTHTSYRGVLGSKGDLGDTWSYDAYYQYGRTNYSLVYKNEFSIARLTRALDVVADTRATVGGVPNPNLGLPICRSVLDNSDPTCVPYDIFSAAGPSQASVNYLNVFGIVQGRTSEQIAHVDFTGTLGDYGIKFPWAEDGVGVNVGAEYRKEKLNLNPDQSFQTGDLTGQGAPTLPVSGSFRVIEFFGESQLPIVQDNFIYDLTLGAGYRRSYYELSTGRKFNTDTYKLSAEFAPIKDVRFRAAYNRAVRAPNIQELFAPQFVGLDGSNDPCTKVITAADFGCLAQGLTVGASPAANPAGQYNGLLGGNPNLEPETATTKTLGVILQPSMIRGLAFTVDYWNIEVKDAIQGFGADSILAACVNQTTASFESPACALINRDPSGSLWLTPGGFVTDTPNNEGRVRTNGFDFNGSYSRALGGLGNLSTSFNGTWLRHYKVDNGLTEEYDCAGFYGPTCSGATVASGAPMPKWRHKMRTTLNMKNGIGVSLQWRMVGKVTAETLQDNETLQGAIPLDPGLHIKAQHYFDLATTFTFGDHYNFRLGVNNILDNDPPLVTGGSAVLGGSNLCPAGPCNGNTYPGTWDALGRYIYAGVTLDF